MFMVIDSKGKRVCLCQTWEKALEECNFFRRYQDYYCNIRWVD